MTLLTRRQTLIGAAACSAAALSTPALAASRQRIDKRLGEAMSLLDNTLPNIAELLDSSAGVVLIPKVRGGGLGVGGAYGEGALLINRVPVDYYSTAMASIGIQIGIQQYHTALFLREQHTLEWFRNGDGWTVGADLEYTAITMGENADIDSKTAAEDVYGLVFGKKGLLVGATLEGAKYSRIVR